MPLSELLCLYVKFRTVLCFFFLTINEFCGEIYKNLLTPRPPFLIPFRHAKSHIVRVALVAADLQQSSSLRELHQDTRKTFTLPNHLEGNPQTGSKGSNGMICQSNFFMCSKHFRKPSLSLVSSSSQSEIWQKCELKGLPFHRFYSQGIDLVIQGRYSIHKHNTLPLHSYMNETEEFNWDDMKECGKRMNMTFFLLQEGLLEQSFGMKHRRATVSPNFFLQCGLR